MNARAFHPARRARTLPALLLGLALLSAWFGLLPGSVSSSVSSQSGHPLYRIERPTLPHETCLARSSREPSHINDPRNADRAASEPPRTMPVLPVWLDEIPQPRPVAIVPAPFPTDDQSLIVPPRQPRGPPALHRA